MRRDRYLIGLVSFLLIGCTLGIFHVAKRLATPEVDGSEDAVIFFAVWLSMAIYMWIVLVGWLVTLLQGKDVPKALQGTHILGKKLTDKSSADATKGALPRWLDVPLLIVWLTFWTLGMLFATLMFTISVYDKDWSEAIFLFIFLIVAIHGWIHGYKSLLRLLRRQPPPIDGSR